MLRDRRCLLSRIDMDHVCRDAWGNPHASDDLDRLSLEHVHPNGSQMGRRAAHSMATMVALCQSANIGVPSKSQRDEMRSYLRMVER